MRTIKFRGRNEFGDVYYGGFYQNELGKCYIITDENLYYGSLKYSSVEPDSVAQFTNCLDANGEEIYDGDWVKLGDSYGRTYKPTQVFWADSGWAVRWENGSLEGLGAACEYVQKLYLVKGKSA